MSLGRIKKVIAATMLQAIALLALVPAAWSQSERTDNGPIARELNIPVYQWQDNARPARGVVIAVHGLTMHATVYDAVSKHLAENGFIVVAADMRGYGQWRAKDNSARVDYAKSEEDLLALTASVRAHYKGLPVFLTGESLGGAMAIRFAATHPDMIDGLILSAAAVKHHYQIPVKTLLSASVSLTNFSHQVDVSGYQKNFFSEDKAVADESLTDTLVRKTLSLPELMASCHVIASSEDQIASIPADMPVLIMQGTADRLVKTSSVNVLQKHLKTQDRTIHWFENRGHILLETQYVKADTLAVVTTWLNSHCCTRQLSGVAIASEQKHNVEHILISNSGS